MGKKKLISLLLLSPMAFGQMKPLLEYLNSVDELGTEEVFYANYRCLSLFRMIADVTDGDPDENSTRINGLVKESFDEVLEMTFPLWQLLKEDSSADAFYENLAISLPPMIDEYMILADGNFAKNGDYFIGEEFITGDVSVCNTLVSMERNAKQLKKELESEVE